MAGEKTDFGDAELDYNELSNRRFVQIPLLLEIEEDRLIVSGTSSDVARALGVSVNRYGKVNEEQFQSAVINKLRSLDNKTISFIVENTTVEDQKVKDFGFWRIRIDPRLPIFDDFVFSDHTIILDCMRKKGRLKINRISLQLVRYRPNSAEGVITGIASIIESNAVRTSSAYLSPDEFTWLLQLPRRLKSLNERLKEWDEYLQKYLESIKNKQGWIAYRNLKRIGPIQATVEISIKHNSNNAKNSFFYEEEVLVIDQEIPANRDWKPDEETKEPQSLGSLSKNVRNKDILEKSKDDNAEWVEIKIDLDDDYCEVDEVTLDNAQDNVKKKIRGDKLNKLPPAGLLVNSTLSDEIPLRLQNKAIDRLVNANSANPRLEDFLFDISEANVLRRDEEIDRNTLVEKNLNSNQFKALKTALNTPDLALIQGPPGTGKTTVIAELCNQVTLRGGRVLLASQSNLAVDNALSRLSNKSHIMPIRIGARWTDEGEEFVEGNVVRRWFKSIRENTEKLINESELLRSDFADYGLAIDQIKYGMNEKKRLSDDANRLEVRLEELRRDFLLQSDEERSLKKKMREVESLVETLEKCTQSPIIPSGEPLYNLVQICPTLKNDIDDGITKVLKPAYLENWRNSPIDLNSTIEIYSIISGLKSRDEEATNHIYQLTKLISLSEASAMTNVELNKLQEERELLKLKMNDTVDETEMGSLLQKIIIINRKIKELKDNNIENRLNDEWRAHLVSLRTTLDSYINIDRLLQGKSARIGVLLSELKSSVKPDSKYELVIEKIAIMDKNIENISFELKDKSVAILNNLFSNIIIQHNDLLKSVEAIDKKLRAIKNEERDIQARIDKNSNNLDKVQSKLSENINTINRLRAQYVPEVVELSTQITSQDLSSGEIEELESEFIQASDLKKDSISKGERWNKLKSEWVSRIKRAEESGSKNDYDSIKGVYLKLANVIGATCTETGKYRFWKNQGRDFDLVIIDEVSKATPPELLMPMLLGRQIILVGDHNQLPPTFRLRNEEFTSDEAKDEEDVKDMMKRFEKLVTSSYFEEMFINASDDIKARLTEQYRMHPSIMDAINQFYPPDYQLICGLKDPDNERKHCYSLRANGRSLTSENAHLVWIDSTHKKAEGALVLNIEGREGGEKRGHKSRYNKYEVDIIEKILRSIDSQFKPADNNAKQQIAIISFYSGQIRNIKDKVNELQNAGLLKNLQIRIGTVDRFQGMERPIVIASLVSSPEQHGRGQRRVTSFVKDFRRINVAFSRAQSLLFIVGAADVFRDVPVRVKHEGEDSQKYCYENIIKKAEIGINGSCFVRGYDLV